MEYNKKNKKEEFIKEYKNIMRDENLMWTIIKDICLGIHDFHSIIMKDRDLKNDFSVKIGNFIVTMKKKEINYPHSKAKISNQETNNDKNIDMWALVCTIYNLWIKALSFNFEDLKKDENDDKDFNSLFNKMLVIKSEDRFDINKICKIVVEKYLKCKSKGIKNEVIIQLKIRL